ncbi:MAG: hypothetical protein ACE5KZ_00060 [Candidatus Scalinduaceae bacterium]
MKKIENKMSESSVSGKPASKEDVFYVRWAQESIKNNIDTTNKVLGQLLNLNAVLLGGSIVFVDKDLMNEQFKVAVIFLFLISMIVAFLGNLPYEGKVYTDIPEEIKNHKARALKHKRFFLWFSSCIMLTGFLVACFGFVFK